MIRLRIDNRDFDLSDVDSTQINQLVNRRKAAGIRVCVVVTVEESSLNVILSTPICDTPAGARRRATPEEQRLFSLWERHHLNTEDFQGGDLVAFLKEHGR